MFLRIIKEAFVKLWDKLGYGVLNSVLGALNPIFIYLSLFTLWALAQPDWTPILSYGRQIILFFPPMILASPFFPTTFASAAIDKRIVEYETVYFKKYFGDYFRALWKWLGKSLAMSVIFALAGFLLSFSTLFYIELIASPALKLVLVIAAAWIFILVRMVEFVLIPLRIYNDELNFGQALKVSFKIIALEGLNVLGIMILNELLLAVLTLSRVFSLILYYGISGNLRIYLHKNIVAKHAEKESSDEVSDERLKNMESYQKTMDAWAVMLGKINEKKAANEGSEDKADRS